jgi:hypothetical protein
VTQHAGGAGVGAEQGGENANGSGLARTVGAQQAEDRPLTDTEVHAIQGAGGAEGLDQSAGFDRVGRHGLASPFALEVEVDPMILRHNAG